MVATIVETQFTQTQNGRGIVLVKCCHGEEQSSILFTFSGLPSPPTHLRKTQAPTTTDSVAVRLDWDPPLNDGGVVITNYLIFVNGSQEVTSTSTDVILTLSSTGQHLVEISAVNDCGLMGNNVATIVIISTDIQPLPRHYSFIHYLLFTLDMLTTTSEDSTIATVNGMEQAP